MSEMYRLTHAWMPEDGWWVVDITSETGVYRCVVKVGATSHGMHLWHPALSKGYKIRNEPGEHDTEIGRIKMVKKLNLNDY